MQCPLCGYMMSSFDVDCPRCHGKGLGPVQQPPLQSPANNLGPVPPAPNYQAPPTVITPEDSTGTLIGFGFLSALIPCAGVVLSIISFARSRPQRGAVCLAGAVIGMIIGFFILGDDSNTSRGYTPTPNSISSSSSSTVDIAALESDTLQAYNDELARKSSPVRGTAVSLVHSSGNSYTGYVDIDDGSRLKMDVTYDGNNLVFFATRN